MASFKGDRNYECHYDSPPDFEESDEDCVHVKDPVQTQFNAWVDEHYDVLQELYSCYKDSGRRVFGGAFHQLGDFADFITFVYRHMIF